MPLALLASSAWVDWLDLDHEVDAGTCTVALRRPRTEHLVGSLVLPTIVYGVAEIAATQAALVRLPTGLRETLLGWVLTGSLRYSDAAEGGVVARSHVHPARATWVGESVRRGQGTEVRVQVQLERLDGDRAGDAAFWLGFAPGPGDPV